MKRHLLRTVTLIAAGVMLTACGGGGTSSSPAPIQSQPPAMRTASISFTVMSTARLSSPVQGVQLNAYLPAGVTVATEAGSSTVSSAALTTGNGITGANRQIFGSYSADMREVKIVVVTTEETFRGGEFARLLVTYPASVTLSEEDFIAVNTPSFPSFEAGGYIVEKGSVDLTSQLKMSFVLSF